jgi:putative tryptophan/tyrosine transport system substrate-binding protein
VRRRDFITIAGGAASAGWPVAVRAQPAMPVIGLLQSQSSTLGTSLVGALRQGLADAGFVEGRTVAIVYRSAQGDVARLPALAAELVRIPVTVIAAVGGDTSVQAAKSATTTIPIVFTSGSDPVATGIVASLNRPGGNITGVTFLSSQVAAKHVGLLHDMVPKLTTVGLLTTALAPSPTATMRRLETAAQAIGVKAIEANIDSEAEIDTAFAQFGGQRVDALVIASGAFFSRVVARLVALTKQYAIPAIMPTDDFPAAGGLMSYGADVLDTYHQAGLYVGRILRGDKSGDLPIMQPTKFRLVINMKTARALGLTAPPGLLAIADEVIE